MRRLTAHAGFTIIEVMVVVAMMAVMGLVVSPVLSNTQERKDATIYAAEAMDAIREAQSAVMSGRNNSRYGVHFEGSSFTFFQGGTYAPADPNNIVHTLSGLVTITEVSLSPGGACTLPAGTGNCDIQIADRRGIPSQTGSITFTSAGGEVKTVTINEAGMVDEQ